MVHAEAAIDLDNDSPLRGASAMVPADKEPAVSVRIDKHEELGLAAGKPAMESRLPTLRKRNGETCHIERCAAPTFATSTAEPREVRHGCQVHAGSRTVKKSFASRRKSIR